MNILNMYVLQSILCASEQKYFRIYGYLQIKIIIIIQVVPGRRCSPLLTHPCRG